MNFIRRMASDVFVTVIETALLIFICVSAIIGNVSLFIIVFQNKRLLTVTNMYILNQAAADIMVSVLSMPLTAVTIVTGRWIFGHTACLAFGFITILSFIASVMSLGMIAINRYFYIVKWTTYSKNFSKKRGLHFVGGVWMLSIALSSPPLFGWAEFGFIPGKSYCFVYWPSNVYFMYFMIATCFFGPLSVMVFSYYNILTFTKHTKQQLATARNSAGTTPIRNSHWTAIKMKALSQEMQSTTVIAVSSARESNAATLDVSIRNNRSEATADPQPKAQQVTEEEVRITKTFILVVALFVICWSPFAITMLFEVYYAERLPRAVDIVSLLLGYLNSACNPILYGVRNSAFRKGFMDLYSRRLPRCLKSAFVAPSIAGSSPTENLPQ